jgi:hypothetical protein
MKLFVVGSHDTGKSHDLGALLPLLDITMIIPDGKKEHPVVVLEAPPPAYELDSPFDYSPNTPSSASPSPRLLVPPGRVSSSSSPTLSPTDSRNFGRSPSHTELRSIKPKRSSQLKATPSTYEEVKKTVSGLARDLVRGNSSSNATPQSVLLGCQEACNAYGLSLAESAYAIYS